MSHTALRLLMSDGAVSAIFTPPLTSQQYAELHELVDIPTRKEELRLLIYRAARSWGVKVEFDLEAV